MEELLILGMVAAIVLSSVGIRLAGGTPWKGGALAIIFIVASAAVSTISQNIVIVLLASATIASVAAGAMGVPNRQAANALLGCVLGQMLPIMLM